MCGAPLDDWANGGCVDSRVVSVVVVLSGVRLHTLNFLHFSLHVVIQQEIFKRIVLVVHT